MPLLHLDLDEIRERFAHVIGPEAHAGGVAAQLRAVAHAGGSTDPALHAAALAGLDALGGPFFVSLNALRVTLSLCDKATRMAPDRWESHIAALASKVAHPSRHEIGKWPRRREDRWTLEVTGRDMAEAAAALRAGRGSSPGRTENG